MRLVVWPVLIGALALQWAVSAPAPSPPYRLPISPVSSSSSSFIQHLAADSVHLQAISGKRNVALAS